MLMVIGLILINGEGKGSVFFFWKGQSGNALFPAYQQFSATFHCHSGKIVCSTKYDLVATIEFLILIRPNNIVFGKMNR